MCRACVTSLITDHLTSGLWRAAPSRRRFLAYAASAGAAAAAIAAGREARAADGADTIFRNGTIYPMTAGGRPVEALAIGGGKILAAGSAADVSALAARRRLGSSTCRAASLFPGFIDPHHHTVLSALFAELLLDIGYPKYSNARRRPRRAEGGGREDAAGPMDPRRLLRQSLAGRRSVDGRSWMRSRPQHPIFVLYVNGHVGAANTLAFKLAKIPQDVGELPGGGHFGRGARRQAERLDLRGAGAAALPRRRGAARHARADRHSARVVYETGRGRRQHDAARARHRQAGMGRAACETLQHARRADEREPEHRFGRGQQGLRVARARRQGEEDSRTAGSRSMA